MSQKIHALNKSGRRREAPVAVVTRASPDAIAVRRPDHAARAAVCKSPRYRDTALPALLRLGTARGRPAARRSCCRHRRGRRRWRDRRLFPRHHAVHRGRAGLCACRFHAQPARARGGRRPAAADDAHHPVLRPARSRRKDAGKPHERLLAAIGTGQGGKPGRGCRCGKPTKHSSRPTCATLGATSLAPVSDNLSPQEAQILEVREHLHEALRDFDAAQRRRLADFLLDQCHVVLVSTTGIDRAHRMFTVLNATGKPLARNDILKADLLGSVPPAAMKRATRDLGSGGGAPRRRIREPVQPHPHHVRRAARPR